VFVLVVFVVNVAVFMFHRLVLVFVFVPLVDAEIANEGKVNVFAQFHDFHGWDAKALWDDIKFSTTHCTKIKKAALLGEKTWEKWMATICKPFTMAKIRYFDAKQIEAAKTWLAEG
jgi:hypothetical protein